MLYLYYVAYSYHALAWCIYGCYYSSKMDLLLPIKKSNGPPYSPSENTWKCTFHQLLHVPLDYCLFTVHVIVILCLPGVYSVYALWKAYRIGDLYHDSNTDLLLLFLDQARQLLRTRMFYQLFSDHAPDTGCPPVVSSRALRCQY